MRFDRSLDALEFYAEVAAIWPILFYCNRLKARSDEDENVANFSAAEERLQCSRSAAARSSATSPARKKRKRSDRQHWELESVTRARRTRFEPSQRNNGEACLDYFCCWVGYPDGTWSHEDDMTNCLELLSSFWSMEPDLA